MSLANTIQARRSRNPAGGFTLMELVAAIAVAAVVGYFALSITAGISNVWRNADERATMDIDTQFALDRIALDLESALFRTTGDIMFAATVLSDETNSGGLWINASAPRPEEEAYDPANHRYGWAGQWIRFFTAAPTLNAVGYQIIRKPVLPSSAVIRYNLFRGVVRADYTLETGFDITQGNYVNLSLNQIEKHPNEIIEPMIENILISNVVDFGIRLYIYETEEADSGPPDAPVGMRIIFPADGSNNLDANDVEHLASMGNGETFSVRYPEAAEIIMRVLTPRGAELLSQYETAGSEIAGEWQRIVDENSKLFRRFVEIRGGAL